jgi:thioredoxin
MLAPTVDQLSTELAGKVTVAKLNIDENPNTANKFGVRSIPTLLVLKDGREVDRLVGVQPKQEILRRLQTHLR